MDIMLCGDWPEAERVEWSAHLEAAIPGAHWRHIGAPESELESVEVAVVANPPPGALRGLPRLRLIQSLWAGVDRLLADPTLPPGVPVARMVDPAMNEAMAETALWAVLALHRGFFDYAAQQRRRQWAPLGQRRADEVTVLVLGLGQMGRAAARAIAARGHRVCAWVAQPRPAPVDGLEVHAGRPALEGLLARADVVVNLLPLTPATRGLIDAGFLGALRPGAGLVNLARGAHVVETDLLAALDSGHLGHAVLDVFATEPLPPEHPFWGHERVTVLPHAAAQTDPRTAVRVVAGNIAALQEGRPLAHLVDRARGY